MMTHPAGGHRQRDKKRPRQPAGPFYVVLKPALFSRENGLNRTNRLTSTAISTELRVNNIDLPFADGLDGTLFHTNSTCGTFFGNDESQSGHLLFIINYPLNKHGLHNPPEGKCQQ